MGLQPLYFLILLIITTNFIEFLKTYESLGSEIASFGGPDWSATTPGSNDGKFGAGTQRDKKKGSPVVPGSHFKVMAEGDYVMISITILRGQYEAGKFEGDTFVPGKAIFLPLFYINMGMIINDLLTAIGKKLFLI